jgi:hypothetical protein
MEFVTRKLSCKSFFFRSKRNFFHYFSVEAEVCVRCVPSNVSVALKYSRRCDAQQQKFIVTKEGKKKRDKTNKLHDEHSYCFSLSFLLPTRSSVSCGFGIIFQNVWHSSERQVLFCAGPKSCVECVVSGRIIIECFTHVMETDCLIDFDSVLLFKPLTFPTLDNLSLMISNDLSPAPAPQLQLRTFHCNLLA